MIATPEARTNWELDELTDLEEMVLSESRLHSPRKPPVRSAAARYATQSRYSRRKATQPSLRQGAHRRSSKRATC